MFTAKKNDFKCLLQKVKPICSRKTSSPISNCVLITVNGNRLELQATDFESSFVGSISVESTDNTRMLVPFAKFFGIISNMPTEEITINNTRNSIYIESGSAKFNISCLSGVDDFPLFQEQEITQWYKTDNLGPVLEAVGIVPEIQGDVRAHVAGMLMVSSVSGIEIVSTDSARLHRCIIATDPISEGVRSLPAKKGLRDVQNFIKGAPSVSMAFEKSAVYFKCGDDILRIRELEGKYPDIDSLIQECRKYSSFSIDSEHVAGIIKRMSVMASDTNKGIVIDAGDGTMNFSIVSPDIGEAKESMPCDTEFEEVVINIRYAIEALAFTGESATIGIKDNKTPVYICNEDASFESVIMPMKV